MPNDLSSSTSENTVQEFLPSKGGKATGSAEIKVGHTRLQDSALMCEPSAYRRLSTRNLDTLKVVILRVVNTYGVFDLELEWKTTMHYSKNQRFETLDAKGHRGNMFHYAVNELKAVDAGLVVTERRKQLGQRPGQAGYNPPCQKQQPVLIEPKNLTQYLSRPELVHLSFFKGKTPGVLVTKNGHDSHTFGESSRNSNLMNMLQKMFGQNCLGLPSFLHLDDGWTKQFQSLVLSFKWTFGSKLFQTLFLNVIMASVASLKGPVPLK
ncbi:hypothetical protein Tco_0755382 [Tanacetum coccineum]